MTLNLSLPQDPFDIRPKITVIGVGGAGGNAVNNMIRSKLEGVEFLIANTDAQALQQSMCERRIQLGNTVTKGLGAGARPDIGRASAEEAIREIADQLAGSNMAFITAGMGGGTGTGAAPVIAQIAREQGILTVGVVTKPFHFEGAHRMRLAESGISELQQYVDTLIIIPNQNLFRIANEKTTFADAFKMADEVLYSGVRGVTDLMVMPGLINLDFADIRAVMSEMGKAMMGTGEATGENRAIAAAEAAISNPLLDEVSMKGARGVLINITGGMDMTLFEVDESANRIRDEVDPDANIIFGSTFDQSLEGKIRISVVATGIESIAQAQRPGVFGGANLSVVARNAHPQPAAQSGGMQAASAMSAGEGGGQSMPLTAQPLTAQPLTAQPLTAAKSAVTHAMAAQGMNQAAMSQPGMTTPSFGATALQAQPSRAPMLRDDMADLGRLSPAKTAERQIDDRPFFAPPAVEPATRAAMTAQPQMEARVNQPAPRMEAPMPAASQPSPQAAQNHPAHGMPAAPALPPLPATQASMQPERKKAPTLFEKMTSRITGTASRPATPPAQGHGQGHAQGHAQAQGQTQAGSRPQGREAAPQRTEPSFVQQTSLNLDPTDRIGGQRGEEEMLDIPAFLRRQAN